MVITDMRMENDAAGAEVIAAARTASYHPAVALLTAYPLSEEDWQAIGADKMLVKPMHTRVLLQQIENLLASHEEKLKIWASPSPRRTGPGSQASQVCGEESRSEAVNGQGQQDKTSSENPEGLGWPSSAGRVRLDVGAERKVDIERLADTVVQQAEPIAARLFQVHGTQQIAGLDDHLKGVGQVVGELANLQREVFRNLFGLDHGVFSFLRWLAHIGQACKSRA